MLVLVHPKSLPLTKTFSFGPEGLEQQPVSFPYLFATEWRDVVDIGSLSLILSNLEDRKDAMIVRGELVGVAGEGLICRQTAGVNATIRERDCQWICIDIDDLTLPETFGGVIGNEIGIAKYAVSILPPEFQGIDFHYQFSASMGIKPGIRIHLWFWLERPISNIEAKAWLDGTRADLSLYSAVQPHFTARPVFIPADQDPVKKRSGMVSFGSNLGSVNVPTNLSDQAKIFETKKRLQQKYVQQNGNMDASGVVRDSSGLVIDGREKFMWQKSIEAAVNLTRGRDLPKEVPSVDELTAETWRLFASEVDLSDGQWLPVHAKEKAAARHRDIVEDGWRPVARSGDIALVPDIDPYFQYNSLNATDGNERLNSLLSEFFSVVRNPDAQSERMSLRITMGAGKTSRTIDFILSLAL